VRALKLLFGASTAVCLGACALFALAQFDACVLPDFTLDAGSPEQDAGSDAPVGPPGCDEVFYPSPPMVPDGPSNPPIVVAIHTIDIGDMGNVWGYDLDRVCTCDDDAGPTCVSPQLHCDLDGGIDNVAPQLFNLVSIPLGSDLFSSSLFSSQANAGQWTLLVQIDNWNGQPDDPSVDVAIFTTPGFGAMPMWNGADVWQPSEASATVDGGLLVPTYVSEGAYVAGGVLVAAMPTVPLNIAGANNRITLQFVGGVITGKIGQFQGLWRLTDGVIAARWPTKQIFQAVASFRDNNGKPVICTDSTLYDVGKNAICNAADILSDGTAPASVACDSVSIGIGFTADQVELGATPAPLPKATPGCPAATDPANDSCP
jgi:hypothetical protein